MIFYSFETSVGIALSILPALVGVILCFSTGRTRIALFLLLLTGLLLRLLIISLDPYLHEWDERFHALVAKNLIDYPFSPMLRVEPILSYDMHDWSNNHIWLHKQPLFLWQMALSMKIFGVNVIALRLPSALMGVISIYMIYDIARYWTKDKQAGFIAAALFCFSYYQLDLTSGRRPLDHNDVAFCFYVTASIWAFIRYLKSGGSLKWVLGIGLFAGCAILNKWLTGLFIYGVWILYLLFNTEMRGKWKSYFYIFLSVVAACIVFLPWQFYILSAFPEASAISYQHNWDHFTMNLSHNSNDPFFYIRKFGVHYGELFIPFLLIGVFSVINTRAISRSLTFAFFGMVLFVFLFFSLFVATKMPSYTYPLHAVMLTLAGFGVMTSINLLAKALPVFRLRHRQNVLKPVLIGVILIIALKPWQIAQNRSVENTNRNYKIHNTLMYRNLDEQEIDDRVILNCKGFENIELMFFQDANAYAGYPDSTRLDSLQNAGLRFAAFESRKDQILPDYITNDEDILIIRKKLK